MDVHTKKKVICAGILAAALHKKKCNKAKRMWVRPWIGRRDQKGAFKNLVQELRDEDKAAYKNYFRMDEASFQELLQKVNPLIEKKDTVMRQSIKPDSKANRM